MNINKKPALRVGDRGVHSACCGLNTWDAIGGSATVFIDGKPAHRVGDVDMHCGGVGALIEGSPNVFTGGPPQIVAGLIELAKFEFEMAAERRLAAAARDAKSSKAGSKTQNEKRTVPRFSTPPTPNNMGVHNFGKVMRWGRGNADARARMATLTRAELEGAGVTVSIAEQWRDFYKNEKVSWPNNPSAAGRVDLMQRAMELLQ